MVWFHIQCEKLLDNVYAFLLEEAGEHWNCRYCKRGCDKLYKHINRIKTQQLEMSRKQKCLKRDVSENMNELEKRLTTKVAIEDIHSIIILYGKK